MKIFSLTILFVFFTVGLTIAQEKPDVFSATSGELGADFASRDDNGLSYITCTSNKSEDYPESSDRIASYSISFPESGDYDLYAKIRIGAGGVMDDSFFYGFGFGEKNTTQADDWVTINGIANSGFVTFNAIVTGDGDAGISEWKWLNLSECSKQETPTVFTVSEGGTEQTLQIGGREDGLDIALLAFAKADEEYTVAELDEAAGELLPGGGAENRPIAYGKTKFLGNVYSGAQLSGFTKYWNQVTPENAGKWGSVESSRDRMNWGGLDNAYNLAKSNGFPFKMHVLLWGNQQPSWIESLSADEQYEEIIEWFQAVAERYDDIDQIEVVNEPFNDPPTGDGNGNYMKALGGEGDTGYDWIINAFKLAREYFPETELIMNEYNVINNTAMISEYLETVDLLKEENLIDGIGFQAHAFSTTGSLRDMEANLDRLATADLPIYVTELDIDGPTDEKQLSDYKNIFPIFWEHPAVKGITLWGFRPGLWRNDEKAYLIDRSGNERPAMIWLREYVTSAGFDTNVAGYNSIIEDLLVYPNPVTGNHLTIDGAVGDYEVRIIDLNGKMVFSDNINSQGTIQVNVNFKPGIYMLQLMNASKSFFHKIVVR
ncbi:MAG: endo-1,4-beta-xylanase [Prolixibacteraceae bacterium]|jgi:endo-1,4-beta-xylanase|nr:endo-1,4-beta-xylanase [Prolixibacteraceae bacterium]